MPETTTKTQNTSLRYVPPPYNDEVRKAIERLQTERNGLSLMANLIPPGDARKALWDASHFLDQTIATLRAAV